MPSLVVEVPPPPVESLHLFPEVSQRTFPFFFRPSLEAPSSPSGYKAEGAPSSGKRLASPLPWPPQRGPSAGRVRSHPGRRRALRREPAPRSRSPGADGRARRGALWGAWPGPPRLRPEGGSGRRAAFSLRPGSRRPGMAHSSRPRAPLPACTGSPPGVPSLLCGSPEGRWRGAPSPLARGVGSHPSSRRSQSRAELRTYRGRLSLPNQVDRLCAGASGVRLRPAPPRWWVSGVCSSFRAGSSLA